MNCWCSFNLLSRGLDVDDFTLRAHGTSVVVANRGRGTLLLFPSHFYSIVGTTPARIALLGVSGLRARSSRRNWNVEMQACLWSGCGQLFPTVSDVTSHVNESHIASQSKDTGFRCLWLGCPRTKAFVRDWVLRDHIRYLFISTLPFTALIEPSTPKISRSSAILAVVSGDFLLFDNFVSIRRFCLSLVVKIHYFDDCSLFTSRVDERSGIQIFRTIQLRDAPGLPVPKTFLRTKTS